MKRLFVMVSVLAAFLIPAIARGGTSTGTLGVEVNLAGTCGVHNTTLDFGLQVVNSFVPIFALGSVDVICSPGTSYSVDLDSGQHFQSPLRRVYFNSGGAGPLAVDNFIQYALFKNAAHTDNWGGCCGGGSAITGFTGNGMVQHQPVYGALYASSAVPPGVYTDSVNVVVTF